MSGKRPEGTEEYIMQQTMIRVKDPIESLKFYCDVLGFRLIMYREFPQWNFNVYFVAPVDAEHIPPDNKDAQRLLREAPRMHRAYLQLWYRSRARFHLQYGNADKTGVILTGAENATVSVRDGFGHIGITVPDAYEACERFKDLGWVVNSKRHQTLEE